MRRRTTSPVIQPEIKVHEHARHRRVLTLVADAGDAQFGVLTRAFQSGPPTRFPS
jgi:hypothetical protein